MKKLSKGDFIYFMGIGGTGMSACAGLCQEAGFRVSGSDKALYPPTKEILESLEIEVQTPYSEQNLKQRNPDLVVIANALSRGHPELEYALSNGLAYTSFPALLENYFLQDKHPVVVSGTHGKTTTSSLISYLLCTLGAKTSYFIGGQITDLKRNFHYDETAQLFVLEGDEYDTAFFDKGPKFLHYRPRYLILTNLEFDHADIYDDLEAIVTQFKKLCLQVKNSQNIIVNWDDKNLRQLIKETDLDSKVTKVSTTGQTIEEADWWLDQESIQAHEREWQARCHQRKGEAFNLRTKLHGQHNLANIVQIMALMDRLCENDELPEDFSFSRLLAAVSEFSGVKRRLDHLASVNHIDIYEDFAHHPTAIRAVIASLRQTYPSRPIAVAFEPANATGRRNVLIKEFAAALGCADRVLIGSCPMDQRIAEHKRMRTDVLASLIGDHAQAFSSNDLLLNALVESAKPNEVIVFMSPSSFSNIQHQAAGRLRDRFGQAAN